MAVSAKQLQVLEFIQQYQAVYGEKPSHKVIMDECKIRSSDTVNRIINKLKLKMQYVEGK